uniref:Uncharacterized protein n=1 Tax=Anopheles quadriannulatus TaxID=34691 RepID=A0A182XQS4_ANOQN
RDTIPFSSTQTHSSKTRGYTETRSHDWLYINPFCVSLVALQDLKVMLSCVAMPRNPRRRGRKIEHHRRSLFL